ncbi:MAG: MBL fold metallo-hydrolase, partial [bacterium]
YQVEIPRGLLSELRRLELDPEMVTHVINSHLHFDHIGGNTYRDLNGDLKPTFPNARYVMQKREYEDSLSPNPRTKASYNKEDILPLQESEQITLIEGDVEIVPGIRSRVTGGHTASHQIIEIESEGEKAIFLADLIPTSSHIRIPYVMGYDLYPADTADFKEKLIHEAVENNYLLIFEHSPRQKVGRIVIQDEAFHFFPEVYD